MMLPVILKYGDGRQLPESFGWLSASEREWLEKIQDKPARVSWLIGRLLAKQLLKNHLGFAGDLAAIEIYSRDGLGRSVRPQLFVQGARVSHSLSISHSKGIACVALSREPRWEIGVDLVPEFTPGRGLLQTWFTPSERATIEGCAGRETEQAAETWASKEAAFKAGNQGEPFEPAAIEVIPLDADSRSFCLSGRRGKICGRTKLFKIGRQIAAVAACPAFHPGGNHD